MKNRLLFAAFALMAGSAFAQQNIYVINKPAQALDSIFPYNIPLLDIDSTKEMNSAEVLAIPKKGKKPTIIAFWLTTCMPCHRELATYTANYEEWQKKANFRLVAISIDFPQRFRQIAPIVREKNFPFEVYWDRDRLFRSVMPYGGLNGLPQIFIFDKEGKLAYHHKGFRPGDELEVFAKIMELQ